MFYLKNSWLLILVIFLFNSNHGFSQCHDYNSIKNKIINLGNVSYLNDTSDYDNIRKGIQSLQFDEDLSDLAPLKEVLKNVEIVLLGEQSHGEGTTFWTKIKLIKYLHQELGFDLLLFEGGFYDCKKAWESVQEGMDVQVALGKSLSPLWAYTKEFEAFSFYLQQQFQSSSPLMFLGFDSQLLSDFSNQN